MENIESNRITLFFVMPMDFVVVGPELLGFFFGNDKVSL
jgi:hypothetical protein